MVADTTQVAFAHSAPLPDTFLHVWPVPMHNTEAGHEYAVEMELTASHTSDASHLDPSCPKCVGLRHKLTRLAQAAVRGFVPCEPDASTLEIYADPGCIVCSPHDGQRPCVTVSIYVRHQRENGTQNAFSTAVSHIRHALNSFGVRER